VKGSTVTLALAGVGLAWVAGRCSRGDELGRWKRAARDAIVVAQGARRESDSLRTIQGAHDTASRRLRARVDTLWRVRDSVRLVHDTVGQLQVDEALVTSCRTALVEDSLALTACDRRVALERLRGDTLERIVQAGLKVRAGRRCGLFGGVGMTGGLASATAGLTLAVGCRIL
jgi:hypothetical protein